MIPYDVILGTLYLSQTGLGVLGNSILLSFFIFTSCNLRPTDQIISQLILASFIFLLSRGIPLTISAFGVKNFLDDTSCKIDFDLQRVSLGLSLCSTCLLSGFQAIVISPVSSPWEEVKARAPNYIIPSCLFCWLFNLLIEVGTAIGITGPHSHNTNFTVTVDVIICTWKDPRSNFTLLLTFRDVAFLGLMVCTSGYKVILLQKHHQQVQHLHRDSCCPRVSPEIRVTVSILLLLSTFVSFYLVNGIFTLFCNYLPHSRSWMV
ncbi:vomeronasal type-1 receptor 4-like [Notamacropus eugenii]|uniref:vomeronasal type-1 receptor 4-like n=1 Tax=Notamacropus eugenii TaxID=9315 RepID=UPI003B66ED82